MNWAPPPAENGVRQVVVWRREVGATSPAYAPGVLTATEEAACARFHRDADAALCRESRFLLRHALAAHLGLPPGAIPLRRTPSGKPEVDLGPVPPLRFSVSHTRGLALVAVTVGAEVGVDVERTDGRTLGAELERMVLAPSERAALPETGRQDVFLSFWTLKEAVLKAAGVGLAAPVNEVVCCLATGALLGVPAGLGPAADYTLLRLNMAGPWTAALAVRDRERWPVRVVMAP